MRCQASLILAASAVMACACGSRAPIAEPLPVAPQPVVQAEPVVAEPVVVEPLAPEEPSTADETRGDEPLPSSAMSVSLQVSSAKGDLSSNATQAVMEKAQQHFEMCVSAGEPKTANPFGVPLRLEFRIEPRGTTSAVSLIGASNSVTLCMIDLVRKLQFAASKKPTMVSATISVPQIGSGSAMGNGAQSPQVRIGKTVATGDLDKNIIRRYIRRKLPRVRHCYEKELLVKPKLAGTVVVNFKIAPDGNVADAIAKGVDPVVSDCVAAAIRSIQFPKPKGGGHVNVRYPFTFAPS